MVSHSFYRDIKDQSFVFIVKKILPVTESHIVAQTVLEVTVFPGLLRTQHPLAFAFWVLGLLT